MKVKTLAMIAASGLMAASFAYVVPAYAEDEFGDDEDVMASQQFALADNSSAASAAAGLPSDNDSNKADQSTANDDANNTNATNNSDASNNAASQNSEPATPDVPSGDDDY